MKLARRTSFDLSAVAAVPPSSRGKLFDATDDDESTTASTALSDECQSVISLQAAGSQTFAFDQHQHRETSFYKFRNRIIKSFIVSTSNQRQRTEAERVEQLHQTRIRILLKNPAIFSDFQAHARGSGALTTSTMRFSLYEFLQQMKLVALIDELQCHRPEREPQLEQTSPSRRSFFSSFGFYARAASVAPKPSSLRKSQRSASGGESGGGVFHDDASVLTFDEGLVLNSLAGFGDDEDGEVYDDDGGEDGSVCIGGVGDGDDCSSIGSRSLATTFSGLSSISSPPSSFSRRPGSWRSQDSRSTSLRSVIPEDEDIQ